MWLKDRIAGRVVCSTRSKMGYWKTRGEVLKIVKPLPRRKELK